ncbi:helix-turn-helix domain-containing protein [Psychrobacillus sp. FSL K6-1267]|uniref:helix-turn-helix domain-containing protein n=1 Tax=Psychrobacillus sp. FSL K6-1267 TaxID=2921543 RepID=UPI0030F703B7
MYSIGTELKKIRNENKLSQEEFAERINKRTGLSITKGMVSKWESDTTEPRTRVLRAIAETFNVSLDRILGIKIENTTSSVETLAAHIKDEVTEEQMKSIRDYIDFIKNQHD